MKINLNPEEKLIRDGAANLQRGAETVGGKLFLTDQRLLFQSHSFNMQTGATEISLSQIRGIRPCWTKFLGLIPIAPNSLAVVTTSDIEYRFVLFGRKDWAAAISDQAKIAVA